MMVRHAWSPEIQVLWRPGRSFSRLLLESPDRAGSVLKRPLLFTFVLGCAISLLVSGRLSVRLVADGIVSFAFVPIIQIGALAAVSRSREAPVSFSRAVDAFFVGNSPWLVWLIGLGGLASFANVDTLGAWTEPAAVLSAIPFAWAGYIDFHFFEKVMKRSGFGALRDLVLQRALAWTAGLVVFVGFTKLFRLIAEAVL